MTDGDGPDEGIPLEITNERVGLIFILLTPDHLARQQPRLLADIIGMIESEYVLERFQKAGKPEDIVGAVRDGQPLLLDQSGTICWTVWRRWIKAALRAERRWMT